MSAETQPVPVTTPVNLHYSKSAAEQIAEEKKTAERLVQEAAAERKHKRDERDAERAAIRAHEQAKRELAAEADKKLGAALDDLERLRETANTSKKEREWTEERAATLRRTINGLMIELGQAQSKLATIEERLATPIAADLGTLTKAAEDAWNAHNDAWAALPKGYRKKHRDRAVRKRANLSSIAG